MKTNTLVEIIEGCKKNQRLMQKALYQKYSTSMYAVCLRYTRHAEDAQDVLQNAFVKIFNQIHTYQELGVFEAWMRRIVVHCSIEFLRKKNLQFEELPTDHTSDALHLLVEPCKQLDTSDLIRHIQNLPDGYRTVFNLYVVEGFSHQEIADFLNISINTSKSQLSRARTILQFKLKKEEEVAKQYGS